MEILKRTVFALLLTLLSGAVPCSAGYIVHSVSGKVTITSSGKKSPAEAGRRIAPSDMVVIPEGAVIEILNDVNNIIYTSTTTGELSFNRLILDAKAHAADNSANINSRLNFTGRRVSDRKNRVYSETGMVKRTQSAFDPEASNMTVNPTALAHSIVSAVRQGAVNPDSTLIFSATSGPGQSFTLENPLESPVYFNVLRFGEGSADISPLGLPSASFVLLPGQSLSRSQRSPVPEGERHIVVATHYSYDIDALLEALSVELSAGAGAQDAASPELNVPVFIASVNQ